MAASASELASPLQRTLKVQQPSSVNHYLKTATQFKRSWFYEPRCGDAVSAGEDLSAGPCLSDGEPSWNVENWVCDVAHSPRAEVDNQPENQCQEFKEGKASHFVEVTPECEVVREV